MYNFVLTIQVLPLTSHLSNKNAPSLIPRTPHYLKFANAVSVFACMLEAITNWMMGSYSPGNMKCTLYNIVNPAVTEGDPNAVRKLVAQCGTI